VAHAADLSPHEAPEPAVPPAFATAMTPVTDQGDAPTL
jgi:hypothetical protein